MTTDSKIVAYSGLPALNKKYAKANKKTVLTTGCYDILHVGHVLHFAYCKAQGDILIVGVGSDETLRLLKGPTRPINPENLRARLLAALECVDHVVISEELGKMDHDRMVELLRPNRYVVPSTDSMLKEKRSLIEANGGEFLTCKRLPPDHIKGGISTTAIAKKMEEK